MASWSGLNDNHYGTAYALPTVRGGIKLGVARMFRVEGARKLQELFATLLGAAVGESASKTHTQISGSKEADGGFGGRRTIETITDISRVTAAADLTDAQAIVAGLKANLTRVADAGKNSQGKANGNPLNW